MSYSFFKLSWRTNIIIGTSGYNHDFNMLKVHNILQTRLQCDYDSSLRKDSYKVLSKRLFAAIKQRIVEKEDGSSQT